MKRRVYVPELDMIYDSIAEASEVLEVNAANISKVMKGSRQTAGGYHFISADTARGTRRTRSSLRREARSLFPDPYAADREELRKAIQAVNKQIKRVRGSGWAHLLEQLRICSSSAMFSGAQKPAICAQLNLPCGNLLRQS